MRFTVQLPTENVQAEEEFIRGDAIREMAQAAEQAGFDACFVTDHPIPGERWLAAGGHHTLDPFVALSFAAAATEQLRLHTHVLVLPYRNPFLVAKSAAALDALSGGRLILGVATGYLKSEFSALGVDFDERNELTDEALEVMRQIWTQEVVAFRGRGFNAKGNTALPRPLQKPHPPLWIGGNSRRAIRRAVEFGDAWCPFPVPRSVARGTATAALETLDDLAERLAYARAHAEQVGREQPLDVCFVPFGGEVWAEGELRPEEVLKQLPELEALGVNWLCITVPCETRAEYCEKVREFGETVLKKT